MPQIVSVKYNSPSFKIAYIVLLNAPFLLPGVYETVISAVSFGRIGADEKDDDMQLHPFKTLLMNTLLSLMFLILNV